MVNKGVNREAEQNNAEKEDEIYEYETGEKTDYGEINKNGNRPSKWTEKIRQQLIKQVGEDISIKIFEIIHKILTIGRVPEKWKNTI